MQRLKEPKTERPNVIPTLLNSWFERPTPLVPKSKPFSLLEFLLPETKDGG